MSLPRELAPEDLECTLRRWVRLRQPGIVVGSPGAGKTYTAKKVGEWAESEGIIIGGEGPASRSDIRGNHRVSGGRAGAEDAPVRRQRQGDCATREG